MAKGNPNPPTEHLKATQWRKGQSGNPSGRPKDTCRTLLREIFGEEANLKDKSKGHGISKRELFIRKLIDAATGMAEPALAKFAFEQDAGKLADILEVTTQSDDGNSHDPELDGWAVERARALDEAGDRAAEPGGHGGPDQQGPVEVGEAPEPAE